MDRNFTFSSFTQFYKSLIFIYFDLFSITIVIYFLSIHTRHLTFNQVDKKYYKTKLIELKK